MKLRERKQLFMDIKILRQEEYESISNGTRQKRNEYFENRFNELYTRLRESKVA